MEIKISEDKVNLTEWRGEKMFAVSFSCDRGLSLDLFEILLKNARRRLLETIFTDAKYGKKIKKK